MQPIDVAPKVERVLQRAVVSLMLATSLLLAFRTPTFDFDEALYRRVAEEMKASGHYFGLTWDGHPFLEKPPTYIWTIVASSRLIDGRTNSVSGVAARLPSLLFSLLTAVLLAWFWRKRRHGRRFSSPLFPVIAFGAALFPMIQVTSVLLDPMLTFFTTIVLVVLSAAFERSDGIRIELSKREIVIAALAITAAVAVKGLYGLVAPAIALVAHIVLSSLADRDGSPIRQIFAARLIGVVRAAAPLFVLSAALSAIVLFVFYREAGASFIYEFLVRQHFARGAHAFQGHKGPFWYYLALLIAGGPSAVFLCVALAAKDRVAQGFASWGFPLSWSAGILAFISSLATKLPNYAWPVWPAIALSLCIIMDRPRETEHRSRRSFVSYAAWTGIAASVLLAAISLALAWRFDAFVTFARRSLRTFTLLRLLDPLPLLVRAGLLLVAIAFAAQGFVQWKFARAAGDARRASTLIAAAASLNCMVLLVVCGTVLPFVNTTIRGPLVRVARLASSMSRQDLTTVGLFSPTISSNYFGDHLTQVGSIASLQTASRRFVIIPAWQLRVCRTCEVLRRDGYLLLCSQGSPIQTAREESVVRISSRPEP
ncbi:MAG TPA: hypothetical protein VI391_10185 [Thermoanaerobaculia bacterium]